VAQSGIFSHFSGATVMNIQTLGVSNSSGDIFRNCEDDSFVTIAFSLISRSCGGFQVNVVLYAAGGVSLSITVNGKKETEMLVCEIFSAGSRRRNILSGSTNFFLCDLSSLN
jgi:hypothetical protein